MTRLAPNQKQQRFVAEYLVDMNATQAAIRAGYSARTAKQQGSRLLTNADVVAAIARKQAKIADKLEMTAERVLTELALLGFSNMQDFASTGAAGRPAIDCSKLERDQWAAVSQIKIDEDGAVTLKLYDKRAALVDLGKHLGLFTEKHDHRHKIEPGEGTAPQTPLQLAREIAFALRVGVEAQAAAERGETSSVSDQ